MSPSAPWLNKLGFAAVIRQMAVAVMVVEASSLDILELNDGAHRLFERKFGGPAPARLELDVQIFHPDGRVYGSGQWPLMRSMQAGEEVVDEEYFHVLADGTRLSIRSNSAPIYDNQGAIVAGVLAMEDVTEQKRVLEELRYRDSLLDNVEDGVVATDAEDFRVTAWNQGAERLYGINAANALGRPARELASYPGDESRLELERELLEKGRTRTEFTAVRADGTPVEVELVAIAVRGDTGEVSGYLGIHRDVTERKRGQARLFEARELERARIARALHDEPLQALGDALALAMAARRTAPSGSANQLVHVLQRAAEELRNAVYDLRLGMADEALPELLRELVEHHRELPGAGEVELEIGEGIGTGVPGGKVTELVQIVGEALTNARHHADASHVVVRVWAAKDALWTEVSDNGRGFEAGRLQSPSGHGIHGMQERIRLLGGDLELRSAPGAGTTVRLRIGLAS